MATTSTATTAIETPRPTPTVIDGEQLARIAISKTGMKRLRNPEYFKALDHRVRFAARVM